MSISKRLHLGKFLYTFYHYPIGIIKNSLKRGIINTYVDNKEKQNMESSVYELKPVVFSNSEEEYKVYFLTGHKFWYQSCYSAFSLIKYSEANIKPIFYDDGTLNDENCLQFKKLFPNCEVISKDEIEEKINYHLPNTKYTYIRNLRANYPNIRKLTDIHTGSDTWKLVLDSDMLFFKKPDLIMNWLFKPENPIHLTDIETSYGYSPELMRSLTENKTIKEKINVGLIGLKSEYIDWDRIEYLIKTLIEKEGRHYFIEQALTAIMLAEYKSTSAPPEDYIVCPDENEVINPQAVLHHYVADSKPWYYRYGWKHILEN